MPTSAPRAAGSTRTARAGALNARPDIARGVGHAAQHAAAGHDAATDAGRDRDVYEVLRAACGADEALGDRGHARVAVEIHARPERVRQPLHEGHVAEPDEVRRLEHD